MKKESSLFKTLCTIIATTALALSVAVGAVVGRMMKDSLGDTQHNQGGKDGQATKSIQKVEKTDTLGLIDEYTIYYTDGTTSKFIVTNGSDGQPGAQGFPGADGHTPEIKIGDNGNWVIDGFDTGVRAAAQQGQDGITPHIGDNGNWFIGETDTGVAAEGHNGEDAPMPLIGSNGNWWVGGSDTGVPASGLPGEAGISPHIGDNGNWWIGEQDTGVKAQNTSNIGRGVPSNTEGSLGDTYINVETGDLYQKTEDGWEKTTNTGFVMPHIGDNGDWYLGDTDTGISALARSVVKIEKTDEVGLIDIYTITYSDNSTSTFMVTNGADGAVGAQGIPGENGQTPVITINDQGYWVVDGEATTTMAQGAAGLSSHTGEGVPNNDLGRDGDSYIDLSSWDMYVKINGEWTLQGNFAGPAGQNGENGVSIVSVEKTATNDLVDTYTITYSDHTNENPHTSTFTVTNGADGSKTIVATGAPTAATVANEGDSYIDVETWTYYVLEGTDWADKGSFKGADGVSVVSIELTDSTLLIDTYTITYSDNTSEHPHTSTFTVTNGKNGTSVRTGHRDPRAIEDDPGTPENEAMDAVEGIEGDSYIDLDTWNFYVLQDNGGTLEWHPEGNLHYSPNRYTVTFESNGGSAVASIDEALEGFTIVAPTAPTQSGYFFQGWYTPDGTRWDFSKDVVTQDITLTARWGQYLVENGVLLDCTISSGAIIIPDVYNGEVITSIGEEAFKGKTGITYVALPSGLASIQDSAFEGCTGLTSIIIPSNVVTIGEDAFKGCSGLTYSYFSYISVPSPAGQNPFRAANDKITALVSIGAGAFADCTSLRNMAIPDSVTSIGAGAFANTALETYSASYVGDGAEHKFFGYVFGAADASENGTYVPSTLVTVVIDCDDDIIDSAFAGCGYIENISYGEPTAIGQNAFLDCAKLKSFVIADTVATIGQNCFKGCTSLESLVTPFISESAANNTNCYLSYLFGGSSYNNNSSLVPNSFKKLEITGDCDIATNAFYRCNNLEQVLITGNPSQIGQNAFYNCYNMKVLEVPFIGRSAADSTQSSYSRMSYVYNASGTLDKLIVDGGNGNNHDIIADQAFYGFQTKEIVLPDNITTIGYRSFYSAYIASIVIPDSVVSLGDYAFSSCSYLKYIKLGSGITAIGDYTFQSCSNLETVIFGDGTQTIGKYAFDSCSKLNNIILPASVTSIDDYAFRYNYALTSIVLPSSLSYLGKYSFYYCRALLSVDMSKCSSLTTICEQAFSDCDLLNTVKLHYNIKTIEKYVFNYDKSLVNIDTRYIEVFGEKSFYQCEGLLSVDLRSFTAIGENAFQYCSSLTYVYTNIYSSSIQRSIDDNAFSYCTSLKSIDLGSYSSAIARIGSYAFEHCSSLESVKIPYLGYSVDQPCGFGQIFVSSSECNVSTIVISNGVELADASFVNYRNIKYIRLAGYNWTRIGDEAFSYCSDLETLIIPKCDYYGRKMCCGCYKLSSFSIGSSGNQSWSYIPDYCFYDCASLRTVSLYSSMRKIGDYAFYNCRSFEGFSMSDGGDYITEIGDYAFANCINLVEYRFPPTYSYINGLDSIGDGAFSNTGLSSVTLHKYKGMTVGRSAFANCRNLRYVFIEEGVKSIGYACFENTPIASIVFPDSVEFSSSGILSGCYSLESVVYHFPDEEDAYFFSLFGSYDVNDEEENHRVPASLKTVVIRGDNVVVPFAFAHCSSIETIKFEGNPKSISAFAFQGCDSLTTLIVPYIGAGTVNNFHAGSDNLERTYHWNLTPLGNIKTNPSTTALLTGLYNVPTGGYSSTAEYSVGDIIILGNVEGHPAYRCTNVQLFESEWGDEWGYEWEEYTGETGISVPYIQDGYWYIGDTNTGLKASSYQYLSFIIGDGDPVSYGAYIETSEYYQEPYIDIVTGNFYGIVGETYGDEGDIYYMVDEDTLYRKYNDEWHLENAFGHQLNGNGAPDNSVGENGNQYVDLTNGDVYRKVEGAWQLTGNLKDQFERFGYWFAGFTNVSGMPESLKKVVIYGANVELAAYTFYDCDAIEEIVLPTTLLNIGDYAFKGCSSLRNIELNHGLKTIGSYAFSGCTSLTKLAIPDSVESIAKFAFNGCNSLQSMITPFAYQGDPADFTTSVPFCVLFNEDYTVPSSLKKVIITKGTYIGPEAFAECIGIEEIVLPATITKIYYNAFMDCASLKNINIPDSVTSLGNGCFYRCLSLTNISLPNAITVIPNAAFSECTSLRYVDAPSVTRFDEGAFSGCVSLSEIYLPTDFSMTFGRHAFYNCRELEYMEMNNGTIGGYAFAGSGIQSIVFKGSEVTVDYYAFDNCHYLSGFFVMNKNATVTIGHNAFRNCITLEEIVITEHTSVEYAAFKNCHSLSTVYFTGNDAAAWDSLKATFQDGNEVLTNPSSSLEILYYAESEPGSNTSDYWHYNEYRPERYY